MNFFQELKQRLEKGVETAGQTSQKMLEISRLTLRIRGKKEDIERMVTQLGWEMVESWRPDEEWEMTDSIKRTLQAIHHQNKQLEDLQAELEDLKSNLITQKEQAEKVELHEPEEPLLIQGKAANHGENSEQTEVPAIPAVIYLCPFCAHQVDHDASQCSHCHERFH